MRANLTACLLICSVALASGTAALAQQPSSLALNLEDGLSLDQLADVLAARQVIFIGEIHDRYDHHLNQLEIIRRLHQRDPNLAIGVEYLQQPFQSQVDAYIDGKISETDFLRATEYFTRWGYDYRLYAPIFRFARQEHIPVRALNVPTDLVSAVAASGIAALPESQRAYLPQSIEPADPAYRQRLLDAFKQHQSSGPSAFDHFVQAQLVWDEGMAESAAAYLNATGKRLVILAGAGHLVFGSGIPKRLARRTKASYAIVLSSGEDVEPQIADYLLLSKLQQLPPAGVLNASLENDNGQCRIASLVPGGAASQAGLRKGDVLVSLDGRAVASPADAKLVLWEKKPGEVISAQVKRKGWLGSAEMRFQVRLAAATPPAPQP